MTDREDDYEVPSLFSTDHQVYHCGWTFVTAEFKVPCQFPLSRLRSIDAQNPPAGAYFAVLHNKLLFLYDSDLQQRLFGEIPLKEAAIDLFPLQDLYNDELFARELPIAVTRNARTLFLYVSSNEEKEQWFLALRRAAGSGIPWFDRQQESAVRREYFTNSAQQLEESGDLQWLNAIMSRLLFNQLHSDKIKDAIKTRFLRRLQLAPIPFFVGGVELPAIDLGNCAPLIVDGKHHYTNQSGETMASLRVKYVPPFEASLAITVHAKIRLETAVTGRWESAVTMQVRLLEFAGNLQVLLKAPPSDRLWFAFTEPPQIRLQVDTDSRTINAVRPVVRAAVERAVQEAIVDTLLVPYYSDSPVPPFEFGGVLVREPAYVSVGRQPVDLGVIPVVDRSIGTSEC